MAAYLLSRLSYLRRAAFSLPKAQVFTHFCPSNDANFMLHRWPAPARAFCNIFDEYPRGATKSHVSMMESRVSHLRVQSNDKVVGGAENGRSVLSLLNQKRVRDVSVFPREILDSDEKLFELFEAWMAENDRSYPSDKEKMRRFKKFKNLLFHVHEINTSYNSQQIGLGMFADHLPSDPYFGARLTEEEAAEYKRRYGVRGKYLET